MVKRIEKGLERVGKGLKKGRKEGRKGLEKGCTLFTLVYSSPFALFACCALFPVCPLCYPQALRQKDGKQTEKGHEGEQGERLQGLKKQKGCVQRINTVKREKQ
jgi:hypothetical protein